MRARGGHHIGFEVAVEQLQGGVDEEVYVPDLRTVEECSRSSTSWRARAVRGHQVHLAAIRPNGYAITLPRDTPHTRSRFANLPGIERAENPRIGPASQAIIERHS